MSPAVIATPPPSITKPIWCGWLLALGRMPATLVVRFTAPDTMWPVASRSPTAATTPVCPKTLATDPPPSPHGAPASPIPDGPQFTQLPLVPRTAAIGITAPVPTLLSPATAPAELTSIWPAVAVPIPPPAPHGAPESPIPAAPQLAQLPLTPNAFVRGIKDPAPALPTKVRLPAPSLTIAPAASALGTAHEYAVGIEAGTRKRKVFAACAGGAVP